MKKLTLIMLLACVTVVVHAGGGPFYTGLNQLDKLLNAVGNTDHPSPSESGDEAWKNDFGFTFSEKKAPKTGWSENADYCMLLTIDWGGMGYVQQVDTISLKQVASEKEDIAELYRIDFSGNSFKNIYIKGNTSIMDLDTFDISNNPTLEMLEICDCPNLGYVNIEGCHLAIPKINAIKNKVSLKMGGTFLYEFQGSKQDFMAGVDISQILTDNGSGTAVTWSVDPVSVNGNVYEFDQSDVELTLSNSGYPGIEITYQYDLVAGTPVGFNMNETLCNITVENITNPGMLPVLGNEVKVKAVPTGYYNLVSFKVNDVDKILNADYEYVFELEETEYTFAAVFNSDYSGTGEGTLASPYQVANQLQLNQVRYNLSAYYELAGNIELSLSGSGWEAIQDFTGSFDGKGYVISGLMINRTGNYRGLFGKTNNATIKNLGVVAGGLVKVGGVSGGIVGELKGGELTNCFFSGDVEGNGDVGALVGTLDNGTVKNSYATGSVKGEDRVGGIVGRINGATNTIENCYAVNDIDVDPQAAGGIVGSFNGAALTITKCFALNPSVKGGGTSGRIVGYNGENATVNKINNYAWSNMPLNGNIVSDGAADNKNGADISGEEARTKATYVDAGWDFDNVWTMRGAAESYPLPILQAIAAASQPSGALTHLPGGPITGVENADVQGLKVYLMQTGNLLYIQNKDVDSVVNVYNLSGAKLISSKESVLNLSAYTSGVYFIQVEGLVVKVVKN